MPLIDYDNISVFTFLQMKMDLSNLGLYNLHNIKFIVK